MLALGAGGWFAAGLVLAGLAVFSFARGWSGGLAWKVLGVAGAAALAVGWWKRGGGELPPSAGADYRAAAGGGLPARGDKVPLVGVPARGP